MHLSFFAFFLIIGGSINYIANKTARKDKENLSSFIEKEGKANSTPKKDLSDLSYISLSEASLPFGICRQEEVLSFEEKIHALKECKIVNFTGLSNTQLKETYGVANLPQLVEYDQNFSDLCQFIYSWGKALVDNGYPEEAIQVLEYGISIGSDISGNYLILAHLYRDHGLSYRIDSLISNAEKLQSLSKDNIILKLKEFVHP